MINKRITSAIATGAILFSSFATPAFAATKVTLSGNGSDSNNTANINLTKNNTIVQNNTANVTNNVSVDANTGKNDANDNTGGDVSIETGDADVKVAVKNMLNKNSAVIDCCDQGGAYVKIKGNGSDTDNDVDLDLDRTNEIFQDNNAYVNNDVDVDAKTGKNDANDNTGGDVSVETGDADVSLGILTFANANFASIGGGDDEGYHHDDEDEDHHHHGYSKGLSLWIVGNGSGSDNYIDADVTDKNTVTQDNYANVSNDVDVDAKTGKNDANDNTGGEVSIETGDADVYALVANVGNFNWADLSCDCLFEDVKAKIKGNGSDTDNDIDLDLDGEQSAFQDNNAYLNNYLDEVEAQTGKNDANDNTGEAGGDPAIETGDADVEAEVVNQFNANEAGIGGSFEFEFDWEELWESVLG